MKKVRIFDTYGYNLIDKVRFGQTKPYLEQMLFELGLTYSQLGFELHTPEGFPLCDNALQKFPTLKKYYYTDTSHYADDYQGPGTPYISSFSENWRDGEIHADREDWEDISTLFSKIPRPFNFPFGKLILDGINWYEDSDSTVAIDFKRCSSKYPTLNSPPFKSNRIMHVRNYDDGRKYNIVWVCIEATANPEPRNTGEIIEKLKPYLGEPAGFSRSCIFSEEEYARLEALEEHHRNVLKTYSTDMLPNPRQRTYGEPYTPIPHVADKYTTEKAFANTGFLWTTGQPSWLKLYCCTDTHGYHYEANVQKLTSCNEFRIWLEISGYNFQISSAMTDYPVIQEGESLEILKTFATFCSKMRDEYSAELSKDFGDTPSWYWEKL